MQLSHPGRQVYANMPGVTLAPSQVAVDVGKQSKRFAMPQAMSEADIADVIDMFITSASLAHTAGFDGVEIYAAPVPFPADEPSRRPVERQHREPGTHRA